ncbi:TrmH family RNA methyltransferase [Sphingomonas japonica]|uniref:TrmH family RNA methyltransferase n=1 Tax=Sphingomonas japonica TaxID=511662 RepID=UPI00111D1E1A|nr:TrmH family RNA methyltransferase [Sphingomonas japonica]
MTFWTYILRCNDGTYYTGHTDNLERRIGQHHSGAYQGYTYDRRPLEFVWSAEFPTRQEALAAELRIKSWSRAKKESLISEDWDRLKRVSAPPSECAARAASTSLSNVPRLRSGRTEVDVAPPVIVLVRPQLGENIGKAARAMLNFGLTELRLVTPRDGWPNPQAGPAASGADRVIDQATVFDSVAAATADCAHVYATTVRKRGVTKPVVTPEAAARAMHEAPGRSAILFGPERSGLDSDDVAVARTIITVPINPEFGSLNLAQAVILVAYEWSKGIALAQPPAVDLDPPAPQDELDQMLAQLDAMLVDGGYFHSADRAPTTRRMLRTLLTKPGWSAQEVRTVRGILSTLARPRSGGGV